MIQKKNSKISYVYTHKMQVLMTDQNNINFEAVQFTHKMVHLKSVKVYFYLILINHFLFKNRIHSAESLDYSSNETSMGCLSLNEEHKELFNNEQEKLSIEAQLQKNSIKLEKLKVHESINSSPATNESENIPKDFIALQDLIFKTSMRLNYLLKKTLPTLNKDLDEITAILFKIREKIIKMSKKSQTTNISLIGKIIQFFRKKPATQELPFLEIIRMYYEERITVYVCIYLRKHNMKDKSEKLHMKFNYFGFELYKMKVSRDFQDLDKIHGEFIESEIHTNAEKIFKEKERLLISIGRYKKQANLVLSIFTKFNTLTAEEFKADEEAKRYLM
ncbi:hypothetical protein NBO_1280g0002 [Nosema bombycis CQ1]|uniref:Uncharacterized protein n=1 Tax=Nosema bombycis (strain CQ1 / CVCC 102059) TaxID=578461 RepID=R0MF04_NOSB1|nr:hypothetical protein NBO_1280g0002 [Nosema bombycis CQ1]|eukprot:EOB11333.1 hypothetical protein NBO_1280g0002 [Nosema bombycis CQ1]